MLGGSPECSTAPGRSWWLQRYEREHESWAAVLMPFRPISHPDLSNLLTHFTSRARPPGPGAQHWIHTMAPWQRLASIIDGEELIPAVTYSGGHPAICFTESTEAGLAYLIRNEGYQPWGRSSPS